MKNERLVIGEWYTDKEGRYFQYVEKHKYQCMGYFKCSGRNPQVFAVKDMTPASLLPDFSESKIGDKCFSAQCGNETIIRLKVHGIGLAPDNCIITSTEFSYSKSGRSNAGHHHPTLFHSYEQFKAYWAEQERSMKQDAVK